MKIIIPFLILSASLFYKSSFASHAMGSDITYKCLANNQYEITFTFYRDCTGIPAPVQMQMSITDGIGGAASFVNLDTVPNSPTYIHTVCPSATTTCNGGTLTGIEKWVYKGVITLTGPSTNWIVSHSENARNAALTTITGGGSDNLFVYAVINNENGLCNSSPAFNSDPVPIICIGNQFCFNQGTFDQEGDSLSYQFITPRTGPALSDTVTYYTGYSASQPVTSTPPVSINNTNGEICMTPQQAEVSVMAVLINEYRAGILIGQIERDMQVTVLACNNSLPQGTGFNGTPPGNNQLNVCATLQNCFYITAVDADTFNTTFISWDGSIPSMSAAHTFGQRDTIFFCWTPADSDTLLPHCFTTTVSDDNCPYFGIQSNTYCLVVQPSYVCNPNSIATPIINENDVIIFPQPARGLLNLKLARPLKGSYYFVLRNVLGETVFKSLINDQAMTYDLNGFVKNGIYFAGIYEQEGNILWNRKLVFILNEN